MQQALSRLPTACRGGTEMVKAVEQVGRELQKRTADPRLLFVLSDGEPDNPAATAVAVARLAPIGITAIGRGRRRPGWPGFFRRRPPGSSRPICRPASGGCSPNAFWYGDPQPGSAPAGRL